MLLNDDVLALQLPIVKRFFPVFQQILFSFVQDDPGCLFFYVIKWRRAFALPIPVPGSNT